MMRPRYTYIIMCGILAILFQDNKLSEYDLQLCLQKIEPRGPDATRSVCYKIADGLTLFMGFTRLSIMGLQDGMQPFTTSRTTLVCNGEIYNYKNLATNNEIQLATSSDCEVLVPLYEKYGMRDVVKMLDAEFATICWDTQTQTLTAARDRYGVRPLYYGASNGVMAFASELSALSAICNHCHQVDPYEMYAIDAWCMQLRVENIDYVTHWPVNSDIVYMPTEMLQINGRNILENAVRKRLQSHREIGFLLSGGLDSSLIVAIAARILGPENVTCFTIGASASPDVLAAREVTEFLKITKHHVVDFTLSQAFECLPQVVEHVATFDVTTIRASVPQYLLAQYISENTNVKVVLSGEGSDEIHGSYRYFRDAPNDIEFRIETQRLLRNLHYFDNQRTDRTMAHHGLEVRVPFLDRDYVDFVMQLPAALLTSHDKIEKQLLRSSFQGYLPQHLLERSKAAFSDAVSDDAHNWMKYIQQQASQSLTQHDVEHSKYVISPPLTIDALYVRNIFDKIYPGMDNIIPHYWLPKFQHSIVLDPSATVLNCY